jgi:hypothetical protein
VNSAKCQEKTLMTDKLHPSILSNPMVLMADLGLRALDLTVSSSQNLCDGVDRLTRATASRPPTPRGNASTFVAPDTTAKPVTPSLPAAGPMKSPTLDLVTQGWLQWIAAMGAVASLGAGRGFRAATTDAVAPAVTGGLMRPISTQPAASAAKNPAAGKSARRGTRDVNLSTAEHALATGEPRQRRGRRRPKAP